MSSFDWASVFQTTNTPPTKDSMNPPVPYYMKVMKARKARYIKVYKQRLEAIYKQNAPSKLYKINEWIANHSNDADILHSLYLKVCTKYSVTPLDLYDGHEQRRR